MKKIFTLLLIIISINLYAQYYFSQNYPFEDSLTNKQINYIYQDHKGFLWLGTNYGLYKFNGKNLFSYIPDINDNNSLNGEIIKFITEDSNNNLWITTNNGLNLYDNLHNNFKNYDFQENITSIKFINNKLIVSSDKNLFLLNQENKKFEKLNNNIEFNNIHSMKAIEKNLIINDNNGIYLFNLENKNINNIYKNDNLKNMIYNDNYIWGLNKKGIYSFDIENKIYKEYLNDFEISCGYQYKEKLWLGTKNGNLIIFDIKKLSYNLLDGNYGYINYIYKDNYDYIWISNEKYGLSRINVNNSFNNINISEETIKSIFSDNDNFIWIGTEKGLLKKYDPYNDHWEVVISLDSNINSIESYKDTLMLGTETGLYILNKKNYSLDKIVELPYNIISIFKQGNSYYISTEKGIFIYENNKIQNIYNKPIIESLLDNNYLFFINTDNELKRIDLKTSKVDDIYNFSKIINISNIQKNIDKLYFSSNYGVIVYNLSENKLDFLNEDKGLSSNDTKAIIIDKNGDLWITTNKGISKHLTYEKRFLNYDSDDGISLKKFTHDSAFIKDNKLFFGAQNGLIDFFAEDVNSNISFFPISIENIKNKNGFIEASNNIYNINDNSIKINFSSIDFKNQIKYRYKLVNYETEWNVTDNNYVEYQNLEQGNYKFIIQPIDNSGKWVGKEVSVNINISNNIFQSKYAIAIYIISILSFISIFIYFLLIKQKKNYDNKIKQLIRQHIEESQENSKYLEKMNKKLETLSFFDSLTGIQNLRLFDEIIEREWNLAKRKKYDLSLIIIDIDYFKNYNDEYGHLKGDEVLIEVAKNLKNCLRRATDHVFRYSGEKFAAILPDTDIPGAKVVSQNMKKSIDSLNIENIKSDVSNHITVSIGTSTVIPNDKNEIDDFIEKAESALLKAKKTGRNKIIQYEDLK